MADMVMTSTETGPGGEALAEALRITEQAASTHGAGCCDSPPLAVLGVLEPNGTIPGKTLWHNPAASFLRASLLFCLRSARTLSEETEEESSRRKSDIIGALLASSSLAVMRDCLSQVVDLDALMAALNAYESRRDGATSFRLNGHLSCLLDPTHTVGSRLRWLSRLLGDWSATDSDKAAEFLGNIQQGVSDACHAVMINAADGILEVCPEVETACSIGRHRGGILVARYRQMESIAGSMSGDLREISAHILRHGSSTDSAALLRVGRSAFPLHSFDPVYNVLKAGPELEHALRLLPGPGYVKASEVQSAVSEASRAARIPSDRLTLLGRSSDPVDLGGVSWDQEAPWSVWRSIITSSANLNRSRCR